MIEISNMTPDQMRALLSQLASELKDAKAENAECVDSRHDYIIANCKLQAENANLKTVMIAAAEEIHRHWQAHCDAEGYGPSNLQRRLEEGIPAEYGYTAGAFEDMRQTCDRYRWLQAHTVATGLSHWMGEHQFLDAAIDAAMKGKPNV